MENWYLNFINRYLHYSRARQETKKILIFEECFLSLELLFIEYLEKRKHCVFVKPKYTFKNEHPAN
jgi:hypothetical protein